MLFPRLRFFYDCFQLNPPKGNFNLKITPEQLIFQFTDDVVKVFPEFITLPHKFKLNFANRILNFLKQYQFVEKENVSLSNKNKISIAASYAKLTLGFKDYLVNTFNTILVYPTAKYFPHLDEVHTGHFNPKLKTIMLALDEFQYDILHNTDGKDIALHEFTHALCFEMLQTNAKHPKAKQFRKGYFLIQEWISYPVNLNNLKNSTFLRDYAFSNNLELIAVLIELFFERSADFKNYFPKLYSFTGNMINHPKINSKT